MDFMKRAWHGDIKLWKIFWIYGILISFALGFTLGVVGAMVPIVALLTPIIMLPYGIWWMVATWRAAFNCKFRLWGYLARILVALGVISTVAQLAIVVTALMSGPAADTNAAMTSEIPAVTSPEAAPVAPQAADASQFPAPAPLASPADACKEKLRTHAIASGADPEAYISQNQAWIDACLQKATVVTQ